MISLLNNNNNKIHKTTITIMHFIAHKYIYIYIYSLTCSLLGIDKPDIMLPSVNSFHIQDYTEDSTRMVSVKYHWCFVFSELVHEHYFKFPIYAVQDLNAKISGNSLGSSFSDGCNNTSLSFGAFFILSLPVFFVFGWIPTKPFHYSCHRNYPV